jgi:hypothetical protein
MQYPICFSRPEDYKHWLELAKQAREYAAPCADCPSIYKTKMLKQCRCNEYLVRQMFTHKPTPKKRKQTVFIEVSA